ncbi:DUF418 domain-containing protein [Olivibacter sp. XZL3]|uniref:DUF418 domain-containing protein n=1 Tax=Olivibacter sp. XZL3 TaxID=1735116 RepID=UPI001066AB6E|nr:DUF418 domain-containing protein [Olivibacter sp. XZL3]
MEDIIRKADPSRIAIIDILRGFALYGIILAHTASIYLIELQAEGRNFSDETDLQIKQFLSLFIERKFYLIFSFLFGFSFYIQFRNAKKRKQSFTKKFIWRSFLLFVIGLLHNQFYPFDILHVYAILGLLLVPIRRLERNHLLLITCTLIIAASLSSEFNEHIKSSSSMLILADLGFSHRIIHQLSSGHYLMILGLFCLGYWAGLTDLFNTPRLSIKKITLCCFAALCLMTGIDRTLHHHLTLSPLKSLGLSFCYMGGVYLLYLYSRKWKFIWLALERTGRMGLSNYVLQTIFFFFLFEFVYRHVYTGTLFSLIALAHLFYMVQIILSILWFRRFKYGPLEWLWRITTNLYKVPNFTKKELKTSV